MKIDEKAFSCMTSDEAIRIFLSRNPVRFTISDIAQNLGYHRNTTKKAINRMDDIQSIGSGNYTTYYIKSMTDHYREVGAAAKTAWEMVAQSTGVSLLEFMRSFGYALVKEDIEDKITEEYTRNYNHEQMKDHLIHLKMSYPFEDIVEVTKDDGSIELESSVTFHIVKETPHFVIKLEKCICQGKKSLQYLCEMVAGGLQAGLNFACQLFETKVKHIGCKEDASCLFEIRQSEPTKEDEAVFNELL